MTFYESIANQCTQTLAVWMFIATSGERAVYFDPASTGTGVDPAFFVTSFHQKKFFHET